MDDQAVRAALQRHWEASDASDFDAEHEIYREDAVLDYPQSGERIRGRHNIQQSRFLQPNQKRFTVRRMIGGGDLWVTEFVLTYDGVPSYTVSIMEFRDGLVAHETQYFADRFDPAPSRAHLVETRGRRSTLDRLARFYLLSGSTALLGVRRSVICSPNRLPISSTATRAVRPRSSRNGLSSTISTERTRSESCSSSMIRCASR